MCDEMPEDYMNDNHPEKRKGEVFYINIPNRLAQGPNLQMRKEWKTMRIGETAFSPFNEELKGCRPIFVSREEYEERTNK